MMPQGELLPKEASRKMHTRPVPSAAVRCRLSGANATQVTGSVNALRPALEQPALVHLRALGDLPDVDPHPLLEGGFMTSNGSLRHIKLDPGCRIPGNSALHGTAFKRARKSKSCRCVSPLRCISTSFRSLKVRAMTSSTSG